ncbi:hypothetical protein Pcinc_020672 [Petrolisthes cinctipes]|uniref:Uncharacterized protein n=1 Tax=Petrolisthes cinctipes TaxID=88211 RepID=A0AAE1FHP2_PETCI|nr:hypothetical protein Pcinc_020672 [Petrolisthes cinctipes]
MTGPPLSAPVASQPAIGLMASAAASSVAATPTKQSLLDKVKKTALSIKIKMLKEQTKGMYCYDLVDVLFGESEEDMRVPSVKMRQNLKRAIDVELTVRRFVDYKSVVDVNTAELFMKDKNALEDISRQHIMSNPLMTSINMDDIIPVKKAEEATTMSTLHYNNAVIISVLFCN